jgi:hypothetical protein
MKNTFEVIFNVQPSVGPPHKQITLFLCVAAFLAPLTSHASVLELACEPLTGAEVRYLAIDLAKNSVLSRGKAMEAVIINKNEIIFVDDLGSGGKWKHILNRTTGNLAVQSPGSDSLFSPWWKCEKAVQKF